MTNFTELLATAADDAGDRPAVRLDDNTLTYGQLDQAVARAAGLLRARGVEPGDRVGMQLPNVPYFPIVYHGILRLGAVVVPMNPLLKGREVAYHLSRFGFARRSSAGRTSPTRAARAPKEAGVECLIVEVGEFEKLLGDAEPVEDVADADDDDPAVIIYTSGTTGTPKGATLTHSNISSGAEVGRELVDAGPDSVAVGTLAAVPRVRDELDHERLAAGARDC